MKYKETIPTAGLQSFIHSFWELTGEANDRQWERTFPDGCPGVVVNMGASCSTDSGALVMDQGRTYVVGSAKNFKESFVEERTHLVGVCLKPGAFSHFFTYADQREIADKTVLLERSNSLKTALLHKEPYSYLNRFFFGTLVAAGWISTNRPKRYPTSRCGCSCR